MTEFLGTKLDKNGRRMYQYKCRCCGNAVSYKGKHRADFPAICVPCQKKNAKLQQAEKRKNEDDAIWNECVNTFERAILIKLEESKVLFKGSFKAFIQQTASEMRKE